MTGTVAALIGRQAGHSPDVAAYICGADGRAITWHGLARAVGETGRLAEELPSGARIGIAVRDPLAFTALYLGALAAGRTAVPLDPRLTPDELQETTDRLFVDVLATDGNHDVPGLERWDATPAGPYRVRKRTTDARRSTAMRPAVLLTSSGTSGTPKGIGLSRYQLLHAARRVARHHRFGPGERGYNPLPLFHVNAQVMGLLATLVSGASLVLDRRFDADTYWATVEEWQPTWLNAVPAVLAALTTQPAPKGAEKVRFARSASAPLPHTIREAFTAHTGIGVLETYGMTEAAGQITANPLDPAERRPGSVGLPVGVGLAVLDAHGRVAVEGEVALRGRQVTASYLKNEGGREQRRPARDDNGWLRTGDLGSVDADGFVRLAGRADDVINRGGEKIFPQDLENVLLTHPAVRSAAVVAQPHDRLGQVPVAFVTARAGGSPGLESELRALCVQRLARHKRPVSIEVTDALPTGPTGKILRRNLRPLAAVDGQRRW